MRRDPAKAIVVLDAMLEFFSAARDGRAAGWQLTTAAIAVWSARFSTFGPSSASGATAPSIFCIGHCRTRGRRNPYRVIPKRLQPYHRLMYFNDRRQSYHEVRDLMIEARSCASRA